MRFGEGRSAAVRGRAGLQHVREVLVPKLLEAFPGQVEVLPTPFEMPQVQVQPGSWLAVAGWLKEQGFNMLIDVAGVDYLPRQPRFEVVYHLLSLPRLWRLRVRVPLDEDEPSVPSVAGLWPAAAAAEREVFDLFGIDFPGHPNLTRILLPENWQGFPLRKDYPLRGPRDLDYDAPPSERNRFFPPRRPGSPPGSGPGHPGGASLGSVRLGSAQREEG